ncbi:hypothetical protein GXP67_07240 [Rhodocytophaga rosea]|uniref:Uncharacterized protein n=1 Tax=Rhodocytophaga rosea TaxID=2704465 RepID=A0A6C0GFC2_9BACT|nr:hypothetical protein [Rhodocytophaga rosea]QHT66463.1 hypothetical protein GXP67_07240 [Rhodocytophaga rosea]
MKKHIILYTCLAFLVLVNSCKDKDYDWEDWAYTAVPLVSVNTAKSALPTVQTANTSFFKLSDPNLANQEFEYSLTWEGFGKAEVQSIEVYLGFYKAPATGNPPYPILISTPGLQYPTATQYPLPSRVGAADKLFETVTDFPKTFTVTAAQLATFAGIDLSTAKQNDYFLFKFIVIHTDGRRIVGYQENVCDETRGEPGDCRVGVRFRTQ